MVDGENFYFKLLNSLKKILYIFTIWIISSCNSEKKLSGFKSDLLEQNKDSTIIPIQPIEYKAEFKYGLDSIPKLIYKNMKLTEEKGIVWFSIKIDSLGNIEKTAIIRSTNQKLNTEALRLANLIPNEWKPAEIGPKKTKIASIYNFSIKFEDTTKNFHDN